MKFSFEIETEIKAEQIWSFYSDINKWFVWEDDLEKITLSGNFIEGSTGEMKLSGQPPLVFELVKVVPYKKFTDKTYIPDVGSLYFDHELIEIKQGTKIRHSIEFIPVNDRKVTLEDSRFISQIFSDIPNSVFLLTAAATTS